MLEEIEDNESKNIEMLISDECCPETAQKARWKLFTGEGLNTSSSFIAAPLKLLITLCSYKWPNKAYFCNMFVAWGFFQSSVISTIFLLMFVNYFSNVIDKTALWKYKLLFLIVRLLLLNKGLFKLSWKSQLWSIEQFQIRKSFLFLLFDKHKSL